MGWSWIERRLIAGFVSYGRLIGRRPLPFLLIPLLFSLMVAPGLLLIKTESNVVMLFTPEHAPARREQEIAKDFVGVRPPGDSLNSTALADATSDVNVTTTAKADVEADAEADVGSDLPLSAGSEYASSWMNVQVNYENGRNLLTPDTWRTLSEVMRFIYHDFRCRFDDGSEFAYNPQFCDARRGCLQMESYVDRLSDLLNLSSHDQRTAKNVRFTYPIMYVYDKPFNWAQMISGVRVNQTDGQLTGAQMASLYFLFQYKKESRLRNYALGCMDQMVDYLLGLNKERWTNGLHFMPMSERILDAEVTRTKGYTLPYLSVTIILVLICTVSSSLDKSHVFGSSVEAFTGVLAIGISLLASFGTLFICGRYFNAIVIIAPFLVMCVGIDNDFMLIGAWRQTDHRSGPVARLGAAFAEVGPSLVITSLTDILCFGIGFLSDTPSIANFCLYTAVCLSVRFVYQWTFFAAFMVYVARLETRYERAVDTNPVDDPSCFGGWCRSIDVQQRRLVQSGFVRRLQQRLSPLASLFAVHHQQSEKSQVIDDVTDNDNDRIDRPASLQHDGRMPRFFRDVYAKFLGRRSTRLVGALAYLLYVILALGFSTRMVIDITPQKLIVDDSRLFEYFRLAESYSWVELTMAYVFVSKPPDFRRPAEIAEFQKFVDALVTVPGFTPNKPSPNDVIDPTTTESALTNGDGDTLERYDFWLGDYVAFLEYYAQLNDQYNEDFYDYMPEFLATSDYDRYRLDVRFRQEEMTANGRRRVELDKFRLTVFYRNLDTWDKHVQLLQEWRRICSNFSRYDAVVYDHHHLNVYLDQRITLAPTTLQTSGIALLAMACITALFMPDLPSVFFICWSFLSVDIGVIGFLKLWGVDLNPVTMVCILMTIGFSIYYSIRQCYCFRSATDSWTIHQKLRSSLGAVAWPVSQGGVSTLIGILPLAFVHSYMVRVFFKTIALMVVIGLLHGLFFMPVIMCAFDLSALRFRPAAAARVSADGDKQKKQIPPALLH